MRSSIAILGSFTYLASLRSPEGASIEALANSAEEALPTERTAPHASHSSEVLGFTSVHRWQAHVIVPPSWLGAICRGLVEGLLEPASKSSLRGCVSCEPPTLLRASAFALDSARTLALGTGPAFALASARGLAFGPSPALAFALGWLLAKVGDAVAAAAAGVLVDDAGESRR